LGGKKAQIAFYIEIRGNGEKKLGLPYIILTMGNNFSTPQNWKIRGLTLSFVDIFEQIMMDFVEI